MGDLIIINFTKKDNRQRSKLYYDRYGELLTKITKTFKFVFFRADPYE